MIDIRTPGNLEVIGPTGGHFTDGKTEVKRGEGPCMKPHGIKPGS